MEFPIFKRNPVGKEVLDIEETFNLWMLLTTRYDNVQTIQILRNFIHDRDLSVVVNQVADDYQKQVAILEKEAAAFMIKMPEKPPKDVKTSEKVEALSDQFIFSTIRGAQKEDLFILSRTIRTSTTNDRLRNIFMSIFNTQLNRFETLMKYGKLKDWMDPAPAYKTAQPMRREPLEVGEAFHLWDHISLRYDQLQMTKFFASFVHDADFQALLVSGIKYLEKQIDTIEKTMLDYQIPMVNRPPVSMQTPIDPESLEDVFTYRTLLRGIQEALDLHLRAVVETQRNDGLRQMFGDFIKGELDLFDRYLKYGKAKGWPNTPPAYSEPT